jgi:hypothetical protein
MPKYFRSTVARCFTRLPRFAISLLLLAHLPSLSASFLLSPEGERLPIFHGSAQSPDDSHRYVRATPSALGTVIPLSDVRGESAWPSRIFSEPGASSSSSRDSSASGKHVYSEKMDIISKGIGVKHAVILIGGINGSYHYFDKWAPTWASTNTVVMGWDHDHRAMDMRAASLLLMKEIMSLKKYGIEELTIVAHSMGGLVSKGAIDELSRTKKSVNFSSIDLKAFGTPWGGYAAATMAGLMPGSETICRIFGYPMALNIGPNSEYMKNLAQPMPPNGKLNIYVGTTDGIALPETSSTKSRYASIEAFAFSINEMKNVDHNSYNSADADIMNSPLDTAIAEL